jgi:arsenate reductase-like glutaredoxin family protein
METILPGRPEIYQEEDPVIQHLIDIRTRTPIREDIEAIIEELKWYMSSRDNAESILEEDRINWKELHRTYQDLSDDQILELINQLENSQNGDFINQ